MVPVQQKKNMAKEVTICKHALWCDHSSNTLFIEINITALTLRRRWRISFSSCVKFWNTWYLSRKYGVLTGLIFISETREMEAEQGLTKNVFFFHPLWNNAGTNSSIHGLFCFEELIGEQWNQAIKSQLWMSNVLWMCLLMHNMLVFIYFSIASFLCMKRTLLYATAVC